MNPEVGILALSTVLHPEIYEMLALSTVLQAEIQNIALNTVLYPEIYILEIFIVQVKGTSFKVQGNYIGLWYEVRGTLYVIQGTS